MAATDKIVDIMCITPENSRERPVGALSTPPARPSNSYRFDVIRELCKFHANNELRNRCDAALLHDLGAKKRALDAP